MYWTHESRPHGTLLPCSPHLTAPSDLLASPCSHHVQESSEDESEEGSSRVDSEVRPCWLAGPRVPAAVPPGWAGWSLGSLKPGLPSDFGHLLHPRTGGCMGMTCQY